VQDIGPRISSLASTEAALARAGAALTEAEARLAEAAKAQPQPDADPATADDGIEVCVRLAAGRAGVASRALSPRSPIVHDGGLGHDALHHATMRKAGEPGRGKETYAGRAVPVRQLSRPGNSP